MIATQIAFHFGTNDQPFLNKAADKHMHHIPRAQRLEVLARACGFSTHKAYTAAIKSAKIADVQMTLDIKKAIDFAISHGLSVTADVLYETLAAAARPKIFRDHPVLHGWGYGTNCIHPTGNKRREILQNVPTDERAEAVESWIKSNLASRREQHLEVGSGRELLQALAFVSCVQPIRTPNYNTDSYGLKHVAENLTFLLPGDVSLGKCYVSNSNLIAAALYAGFEAYQPDHYNGMFNNSPNPAFNMSARSLKQLNIERKKNQGNVTTIQFFPSNTRQQQQQNRTRQSTSHLAPRNVVIQKKGRMKIDHLTIAPEIVDAYRSMNDLVILFSIRCGKNHALTRRAERTCKAIDASRCRMDGLYHNEITDEEFSIWGHIHYKSYDDLPLGSPRNGVEHYLLPNKRRQPRLTGEEFKTLSHRLTMISENLTQIKVDYSAVYAKGDTVHQKLAKAQKMCEKLLIALEAENAKL